MKKCLGMAILTMGCSGLVAQMLLLRELLIVFSGNELSIGINLANWLILEAFGCFFVGKQAYKTKNKMETFVGITILFSLSLPTAVYLTRILKSIMGISIGESIGFLPMLYSSFLILLPVSISHGALFPLSCQIYSLFFAKDASSVGKVYVYETVGSIAGGIVWTYLLIPYLNAFQIATGLALLNFFICLILLIPYLRVGILQRIITAICSLLLIFWGYLFFTGGADRFHSLSIKAQWKEHNIVHYQNSIYGNLCVVKSEEQYLFFLDGLPNIITPIPDIASVEEFVHLPLLAHLAPKRVLVLSGGAGGVINEILKHPQVERIEYVELDPLLLNLIRKFPTPLTENELTNRKVQVKYIDGRLFLKMTPNKYDLILVGLQDPSNLQTNRFFTKEFFSLTKKRLMEDGILVIGLPGSLAYINEELKNLNTCIFHTLQSVFPYVRVFPGGGRNLFLSSNSKGISLIDKTRLVNRLKERGIKVDGVLPWHIEEKLHPGWQDWFLGFLEGSTQKINCDFKPLGLFYSISHWNALFAPHLCKLFTWFEKINLPMFFALFAFLVTLFFLLWSKNKRFFGLSIPLCIATTGFAGMIFDLVLLFAFQSIYGYVFSWMGLLVTFFMAGVAGGAMIITQVLPRIKNCLHFFINSELVIICFSLVLPFIFLMAQPYFGGPGVSLFLKILFLFISLISGLLTGGQFPLANKVYLADNPNLSKTAGILYSCDLLGGWLGGVVGAVVLLPVLGLFYTCGVIVLLKLSSFIVIRTTASRA